ncbi:MAG: sigma-70 family RNA polymerase sigma factor [Candidatus Zixiibacteriota bacterium]|nr:MAG: sigma-70 family RNA polymerase sigma factor [candidate division Zixibacteria bacterium]
MSINTLYESAINGGTVEEKRLFDTLSVTFRLIAYQRIQNRDDADEIIQESLLNIAKNYAGMDFTVSFSAWAYKVLSNEMLRYYRNKKRRGFKVDEDPEDANLGASWKPDPTLEPSLIKCLKKMCRANSRYARILNLKFQGYDTDDICKRLVIKSNNLYVILSRARSMLKECLEKQGAI